MISWLMEKIILTIGYIGITVYYSISMLLCLFITFFTVVGVLFYYPFLWVSNKVFPKRVSLNE